MSFDSWIRVEKTEHRWLFLSCSGIRFLDSGNDFFSCSGFSVSLEPWDFPFGFTSFLFDRVYHLDISFANAFSRLIKNVERQIKDFLECGNCSYRYFSMISNLIVRSFLQRSLMQTWDIHYNVR